MTVITVNAALVRPLDGSTVLGMEAGSAVLVGDSVTLASDGQVDKTANATAKVAGLIVATEEKSSSAAQGKRLSVVAYGPVTGFSGLVPGALSYLSATAGKLDTAGTVPVALNLNDTTVFINPAIANMGS